MNNTNIYKPTPEMRTNKLSKTHGGVTVTLIYDGFIAEYTNIKEPLRYITSVRKKSLRKVIGYILKGKTVIFSEE
jgi:hypothetical protein